MIYYSVEYLPVGSMYNCYNQFGLTRWRLLARLYEFEAKRRYAGIATVRVREM